MSVDRVFGIWLACLLALMSAVVAAETGPTWGQGVHVAVGAVALTVAIWLGRERQGSADDTDEG